MTARINRKLFAGIIGAALMVVTLGSISAGAAAPIYANNCAAGVYCSVPYAGGYNYYGGGIGGATYFDPRYCPGGQVSIVPEPSNGAPINVCTLTGQRVYPVYPDVVPYAGIYNAGVYNAGVYNAGIYNTGVAYNPVGYRPYIYR